MQPSRLTDIQVDAITEISNIGMGHAATALSRILDTPVNMKIPRVSLLDLASVHDFVGGAELPVAGVMLRVTGDFSGLLMLIFPHDSVRSLVCYLTGACEFREGFDELDLSAINEIGNILGSAYLNAVASLLGLTLLPSVPLLRFDMAGALLDPILSRQCQEGDTSLLVTAEFSSDAKAIAGRFYLMPDPESLEVLVKASGTAHA